MLRVTAAVLAVALAGTASAGWRSLRIDGSSEDGFDRSVAAIRQELPEVRRHVFELALQDIWAQGTKTAEAEQREYTVSDYLREVDGLGYKAVVTFIDPTGDTADRRFAQVYAQLYMDARTGYDLTRWEYAYRSYLSDSHVMESGGLRGGVKPTP